MTGDYRREEREKSEFGRLQMALAPGEISPIITLITRTAAESGNHR